MIECKGCNEEHDFFKFIRVPDVDAMNSLDLAICTKCGTVRVTDNQLHSWWQEDHTGETDDYVYDEEGEIIHGD